MEKLAVKIQRTESKTDMFEVNYSRGMTVLEVLEAIYRQYDPSIAYRFSCGIGLCATCIMMVNGKPKLSCMEVAKPSENGYLTLSPLPKGETIKDLVKKI